MITMLLTTVFLISNVMSYYLNVNQDLAVYETQDFYMVFNADKDVANYLGHTWDNGQSYCQNVYGTDLATVDSAAKQAQIDNTYAANNYYYASWIGIKTLSNQYVFANGDPIGSYTNWKSGYGVNTGNSRCVMNYGPNNPVNPGWYGWADWSCNENTANYVCNKPILEECEVTPGCDDAGNNCANTAFAFCYDGLWYTIASPCSGACGLPREPLGNKWRDCTNDELAAVPIDIFVQNVCNLGKCGSVEFDNTYNHCDCGDIAAGYITNGDNGGYWEYAICRDDGIQYQTDPNGLYIRSLSQPLKCLAYNKYKYPRVYNCDGSDLYDNGYGVPQPFKLINGALQGIYNCLKVSNSDLIPGNCAEADSNPELYKFLYDDNSQQFISYDNRCLYNPQNGKLMLTNCDSNALNQKFERSSTPLPSDNPTFIRSVSRPERCLAYNKYSYPRMYKCDGSDGNSGNNIPEKFGLNNGVIQGPRNCLKIKENEGISIIPGNCADSDAFIYNSNTKQFITANSKCIFDPADGTLKVTICNVNDIKQRFDRVDNPVGAHAIFNKHIKKNKQIRNNDFIENNNDYNSDTRVKDRSVKDGYKYKYYFYGAIFGCLITLVIVLVMACFFATVLNKQKKPAYSKVSSLSSDSDC